MAKRQTPPLALQNIENGGYGKNNIIAARGGATRTRKHVAVPVRFL